ncbi:hypothetical protein [Paenibacillus sp. HJGM_3]|uniref:hypothetical protein n=1 Tax=Paenibacillus sp. HJGM_3 TaxID=3379816 RepID=UPI00385AB542
MLVREVNAPFVYEVATHSLPVSGLTGITGMATVDGKIWGLPTGHTALKRYAF